MIRAGRVSVDGEVITDPALPVDPQVARIAVNGRPLRPEPRVYILLYKPRGALSTVVDPRGRRTVLDVLGEAKTRLYPAGRLDADTEGLLIITNDGELTLRLTHPRYGVEKVYQAEVKGRPSRRALERLKQGVMLDDGSSGPARVRVLRAGDESSHLEVIVRSGRKRLVRRMLRAVGHPVISLLRTRVGPLTLGGLKPGEWRHLTQEEVERLRLDLEKPPPSGREGDRPRDNAL